MEIEFPDINRYIEIDDNAMDGLNFISFFEKFNYENLETLEMILSFCEYAPEMNDLVERLKHCRNEVYERKDPLRNSGMYFDEEIKRLDFYELGLLYKLLEEASLCASSNEMYEEESVYLAYLEDYTYEEIEKRASLQTKRLKKIKRV